MIVTWWKINIIIIIITSSSSSSSSTKHGTPFIRLKSGGSHELVSVRSFCVGTCDDERKGNPKHLDRFNATTASLAIIFYNYLSTTIKHSRPKMKATIPFVCVMYWMSTAAAFTLLHSHRSYSRLALASVDVAPVVLSSQQQLFQLQQQQPDSPLSQGIWNHLSSSTTLALQERKAPTAEEVQQKKNTFNLIFWGGGFVAPFLATIFYFGFRFWEK